MPNAPRSRQRSRVTNGSALAPNIDGRSAWVRRTKDLIALHLSDLGGADHATAAEVSIVRRIAVLSVELESLEATFATVGMATGDQLDLYSRVSNSLRRMLESIGLERKSVDITPSVDEFLAEHAREKAARTSEPLDAPSLPPTLQNPRAIPLPPLPPPHGVNN
jgi:hypothetical protein